jgi:hypothetical protein
MMAIGLVDLGLVFDMGCLVVASNWYRLWGSLALIKHMDTFFFKWLRN